MEQVITKLEDFFEKTMTTPKRWPKFMRRAYLLTLPISIPIWFVLVIISWVVLLVLFIIIEVANWVASVWR